MNEFLAFVDEIGRTIDGGYIYRFDFTTDTEIVWGDFFNVTPSGVVPDLQPDNNTLSSTARAIFPRKLSIAKRNYCFSMQDCIDGIMPLAFCEIDGDTIVINEQPFFVNFGESIEDITAKLNIIGIELFDKVEVEKGDDTAIDNLINSMDNNDDDDDIDPDF